MPKLFLSAVPLLKRSTTVPLLLPYILDVKKSKIEVNDVKKPKLFYSRVWSALFQVQMTVFQFQGG